MRSISLLLVAFALPVRPACYYPSGKVSNQDVPCNDGDEASTCCGPGLACLSNNLCMATGSDIQSPTMKSTYVRGTCTDKSWRSGNCPNFCVNKQVDRLGQGMPIESCDEDDADGDHDVYYCVNKQEKSCKNEWNVLVFEGPASTITTIGVTPTSTGSSSSASSASSIEASSAETSATEASPTESQPETPPEEPTESSANDSSKSSVPDASGDSTGTKGSGGSGLSSGAKIGVGVGVGLGGALAILGAVAFFLIRRRRRVNESVKELPVHEPRHELIGDEPTRKIELDSKQNPASELGAGGSPDPFRG